MTEIERLKEEIGRLTAENNRLKGLLDSHGISWQSVPMVTMPMGELVWTQERGATVLRQSRHENTAAEKARRIGIFMKLFCARKDFYAERWEGRDGRKGYAPACSDAKLVPLGAIAGS